MVANLRHHAADRVGCDVCPGGAQLTSTGNIDQGHIVYYRASKRRLLALFIEAKVHHGSKKASNFGSLDGDDVLYLPGTQRLRLIDYVVRDLFLAGFLASREAHEVTWDQEALTLLLGRLNLRLLNDEFPNGRIRGLNDFGDWTRLAGPPIHLIVGSDLNRGPLFDGEAARFGFCLGLRRRAFEHCDRG
jgi:hypothetical protein